ncbi:alpha/beta hydrolase fold domain-containing protein [Nocardia colli]|uniref:Alpha/beta hydrolase fold domain-containing protein n=1 Tax=Nocardia colli TaxID=2545717 RepID=A0A5N0DLF8_9NOCA|nr:alpha/beta hydrolase fold domain-containing protein [Nocardia colli]KAA8877290.1 alpha/beta hydrolase fold domain-containing protein [Nocardia colli]
MDSARPGNRTDAAVLKMTAAPDAIELRHLRAFVAVADELNFSRAADRLYITQPALSRQIRSLERLIGCDLLRRSTHRVELTVAGSAFLARARRVLGELDDAVAMTRSVGGEHAERLTRLWELFVDLNRTGADLAEIRAAVEQLHAQFAPPTDVQLRAVNAGGVPSLLSVPAGADPASAPVLFLHGGGHVAGSSFGYRHLAGALAAVARRRVLVPEYRLAPEHPFPAALEDALRAYLSVLDAGAAPETVSVAGDSSGAGLALSMTLALRERRLPMPGRMLLMCPWIDLTGAAQTRAEDAPLVFTPHDAARFADLYLAGHPADDPLLTPLRTDLSGLPPILVQAATGDSVLPEARLLVDHARAAGVTANLDLYRSPTHTFHLFWSFLPEAAEALERGGRFLAAAPEAKAAAPSA